jgi:hypothetical protein
LRRDILAAREREVRMPRAKVRCDPGAERRVDDAFVQLEKVRMSTAYSDPYYFWLASGWKSPEAAKRKEEARELDREQSGAQFLFLVQRYVAEESQSQMNLFRNAPTQPGQMWV